MYSLHAQMKHPRRRVNGHGASQTTDLHRFPCDLSLSPSLSLSLLYIFYVSTFHSHTLVSIYILHIQAGCKAPFSPEESMKDHMVQVCLVLLFLFYSHSPASTYDGPQYDSTAYTECKQQPEDPLYDGGILKYQVPVAQMVGGNATGVYSPAYVLRSLTQGTIYSFSSWVKINGADSAVIRASLMTENTTHNCIGTVVARSGCWSFLKGGFVLASSSDVALLYFQNSNGGGVNVAVAKASLQPFTEEQWRYNQESRINAVRKRAVTIHVSDGQGDRLQDAAITVEQVSKEFPFGSSIIRTILGNKAYQDWFVERFNAAVFEDELKWYTTEPKQGQLNYTLADRLLEFVRANQIVVRGHNIFWEDPYYTPAWVRNLTSSQLQSAVESRIQSLMGRYKEEFIHWDINNEMLHFDFYEQRLGRDATLRFYKTAHEIDPLATLFMNEFNVVETCDDVNSTVDTYISRMRELKQSGVSMNGIGLEGHFTVPNRPLIRAILDKLATLRLPIWLTEVDISKKNSQEAQAIYLEEVLREGFSHSAVNGILLWAAMHSNGCYQMCLTDNEFHNLPAGDVVDKLLNEWQTGVLEGQSDEHGSYNFFGFLGEYRVTVNYGNRTAKSTFSLSQGDETRQFNIQV